MATVHDIFEVLGGPAKAGRVMGVSTEHAATMRRRGSIPVRYWSTIIAATSTLKDQIDLNALHRAHAVAVERQRRSSEAVA